MNLEVRNMNGRVVETMRVRDDVFGASANPALVHQVMVAQLAAARQGTASSKTRAQVSGGGRKPRPQKHSGFARAGSIRAPNWRGGGVVFGVRPRSYRQGTPKRMKRMAMVSALSDKVREGDVIVVESFTLDSPKTREVAAVLSALEARPSVLLVADGADKLVLRAARNIPRLNMIPAALLNTVDLLKHRKLIMTVDAVRKAEEIWGGVRHRGRKGAATTAA